MISKRKHTHCVNALILSLLILLSVSSLNFSNIKDVKASRTITTLGSGGPNGPDTLEAKLLFFAEGKYDTVWQIDTIYDTTRLPLDIILAVDLSLSMSWIDSIANPDRWPRIAWAKLAALKFFDFFDSLTAEDRLSVMGWTAAGTGSTLPDTANTDRYYQKWLPFISDFDNIRAFIRDSLFIDSTGRYVDTFDGKTLVIRDNIPNGNFTSTPLRISSICAMQRLANFGRPDAIKALIMLTDGANNDGMDMTVTTGIIDSLTQAKETQFFGIGFMSGDTAELCSLSSAGGGSFYNATNPAELDSAYAKLARQLVDIQIDTSFTTEPILVKPDTVFVPNDVVLAIDLSGSMDETDGSGHWRIAWAKVAALGFLDSLKTSDRVAILGWTGNNGIRLTDTSNVNAYYQKWCHFTSQFDLAGAFICDEIYLDGSRRTDTINGMSIVIQDNIPTGSFGYTPLRISSIVASTFLSRYGRPDANKLVIMLTDGKNNDNELLSTAENFLDSLKRVQGLQFHTIGFMNGDVTELNALALSGGGIFYDAKNSTDLLNAYASLANMMVLEKIAAHKLTIQEVIQTPPLYYIEGSQKTTDSSSVLAQSFDNFQDAIGNTVMRWNFKNIRYWGKAEVCYEIIAVNGGDPMIGVDSTHTTTGFWSQMVYTDNNYNSITINLKPSGGSTPVYVKPDAAADPMRLHFSGKLRTIWIQAQENTEVGLKLYELNGRIVYDTKGVCVSENNLVRFQIPSHISAGVYITSVSIKNIELRKKIYLNR